MSNERSDSSRISDPGLIEDIVRFSHLLRDHGISVSLPAVLSAIDGLPLIDIFSLSEFQCLLRVNFVCRKEDLPKYDRLFYRYWRAHKPAPLKIFSVDAGSGTEPPEAGACLKETATNAFGPGGDAAKAAEEWTLRYSPEPLAKPGETKELHFAESGAFYDSISKLLRPLTRRMSRRSQYTIRGKEIDLRRILRRNMQFGGGADSA